MQCPNCNSKIPDIAKFCPKCGVSLQDGNKARRQPIERLSVSPNINVSPEIKVEGGGKVEFSPVISLSSGIEVKDEGVEQQIQRLENEINRLTEIKLNLMQLEKKYSKEDLIKILEAFRILLRMRQMTGDEHYPEEYLEQLKLLKNYVSDFGDITIELERVIRVVKEATFPNSKVSGELGLIIRKACDRMLDVWIAEFLKSHKEQNRELE